MLQKLYNALENLVIVLLLLNDCHYMKKPCDFLFFTPQGYCFHQWCPDGKLIFGGDTG